MQEQRAYVRRLIQSEAMIADALGENWRRVQMLDVSRMGLAFASADAMESGVTHMFNFFLPGNSRRFEVVVKVVHCATNGTVSAFRIGARFVAVDDDTVALIAQFTSAA